MKAGYTCELQNEPSHYSRDYSHDMRIHCRVPLKVTSAFKMIHLFESIDKTQEL